MKPGIEYIKLIAYDFDGVMTNNKVYIDQYGREFVQVHRADGLGVAEIKKMGLHQIIISTEKNKVVANRAAKLDIPCLQGVENKQKTLFNYSKDKNIDIKNVAFVGNDINDLEALLISGIPICPADSHESIKKISKVILHKEGGDGVVREIFDLIKYDKNRKIYYIISDNK